MPIDEFAPQITSVDAVSNGEIGLGSTRCTHFANGTSVVEEVIDWLPGIGYRVKLADMASTPLKTAHSDISITLVGGHSRVTWTFDYQVKFGPFGWLMGQTVMKKMMGKIIDANLVGLSEKSRAGCGAMAPGRAAATDP